MLVNTTQAQEYITDCIKAGLVAMLEGPPATGKSDIVKAIAKRFKLYVIDIRLSQCEPPDLNNYL